MGDPVERAQDVLEASRGMLRKRWYVVFTKPTNGLGPVVANPIAAGAPMHASVRSFTVRPWLLNEGTVTAEITYSDAEREVH